MPIRYIFVHLFVFNKLNFDYFTAHTQSTNILVKGNVHASEMYINITCMPQLYDRALIAYINLFLSHLEKHLSNTKFTNIALDNQWSNG